MKFRRCRWAAVKLARKSDSLTIITCIIIFYTWGEDMQKKLTLNIDDELINFAHTYSRQNGLSISKLFEQYLSKLKSNNQTQPLHSKVQALYGIFHTSPIPDKNELRQLFNEKSAH